MPLKRPIEEMMDLSYDAHMTNDLVSTKNTILESCACKKPKLDFYGGTTFLGSRTISHQQTVSNLVATTNNLLNYRSSITTSNVHGGDVTDGTSWKRSKQLRGHPLLTPTHLTTENRILHQDYKKLKLNQELRDKCSYSLSSLTLNDEEKVFKDTYLSEKHEEELITSPECDKIQADIPQYHFPSLEVSVPPRSSQSFTEEKATLLKQKLEAEKSAKMTLLTIVSTSLMQSPNFKKANDPVRLALTKSVEKIAEFDPEFILKTVLYAREELNLRQTSNFLLALAAFNPKTRIFLQKYFTKCIRLPTDWMKVAELYQVFSDSNLKPGSLPASLRRAMREAFVEFDEYQLGKYNKKKKKKKKEEKKKKDKDSDDDSDDEEAIVSEEDEEITEQKAFTLKRLIRLLHISKPAEHVMGLLGKKYPSDRDSFRTSGLPGVWNEELAGKRMKLRVPETWETQIALHGPKAWAKLIDDGKLPYMAMLRNIRNLLLAGITESHHKKVISTLADEKRVIKSRQFPLRFFTAYNVLGDLRKLRQDEGFQNMTPKREEIWVKKWKRKLTEKLYNFTVDQVDGYKKSVDKAVEIATVHNLQPIQGRTLIMCDVRSGYYTDCKLMKHALAEGTGARLSHAAVLLGAMFLSVCENGEMVIFPAKDSAYKYVNLEGKSILEKTQKIIDNYVPQGYFSETLENQLKFLGTYLDSFELRDNMQYLDTVVLLTHGKNCLLNDIPNLVNKFLCKYRAFVNPNLLFVLVDLNGTKCDFGDMHLSQDNVFLSGFSDQVLKFLAERGSGAQLAYVEDIDIKYNLKPLPNHVLKTLHQPSSASESSIVSLLPKAPKWKTVKVFVSSTFRDMNSERDILTKYVFPELKRRASAFHINICEVDLRWGITEKEAAEESLLSTCLSEVKRCELFVGIIGSRYGRTPSRYVAPDDPEFDWVREFPPGASITEMEIHCAALNHPEESKERTFFYFRDSSFEKDIPPKWLDHFCSESPYHAEKVRALKDKIRKHGFKIYDGYPCTWIGEVNGIAVVGGLELFGQQVLEDLWNAVQKLYIKDGEDEVDDPYAEHLALAASYKNIVGHEEFINDCIENIENKNGIHIIEGKAGSGKSAILGYLSQKLDDVTFIYFVGLLPGSTNLHELLLQLVKRLCELYSPYSEISMEKECLKFQLNDILHNVSKHFKDNKLIFIIDGLDNISEDAPEQISWIPYNLPSCVRFVCSVTAGSAVAKLLHEQEMALEEKLHLHLLEPLKVPERKEMISLELAPYGKALDENPFNNQLSILATKRDAGIPLYLRLACEELRSFGFMEQLTNMLRILPKSIPLLLQSVLKKMEDEHGEAIIQHSLCILALSPEGLEEHELHFVLSKIMNVNDNKISKIEDAIPPVRFAHLMCSLRMFLNPGTDKGNKMIILTHKEVTKAVEIRYMQSLKKDKRSMYHKVLADYFHADADPLGDLSWKSQNARSFRGLLFHLIQGHFFVELAEVLCDLSFIQSAISIGIGFTLLDIYLAAQHHLAQMKKSPVFTFKGWKNTKATNLEQAENKIEEYFNFLLKNMDILQKTPHIVWQQARLQFDSDQIRQESLSLNEYSGFECSSKLPGQSPVWKLTKFAKTILCLAISPDEKLCVLGDQDGVIWLVDINNSKLLKTFANHTSAVTGLTFVGRDMLCSVSKDCQLVFCKICNEDRIIKSNAHSRPITCCCSDPGGTIVVTGSWDRTIRVWNVRDSREISCINKNNCSVSCIVFHPSRQVVISGGWDKKIKLWDLQSLKRIAVLSGHKASVRSIVITPCGSIIASASSSGEVFLWSATSGHRIGTLKGHVSTVNCISISSKGSYLATASSDLTIKMWRYNDENSVRMENMKLSKHHTHSAYISLDLLALAGRDSVQILDTENNRVEFTKIVDDVEITCMEALYSSDTPSYVSAIVYGTREGTVEKMHHQGQPNAYRIYNGKSPISVVKNIQNWIIAGTESGNIFVINIHDEREMFSAIAHKGRVLICSDAKGHSSGSKNRHVSISFVTVGDDQHLAVWNLGKATTGNPWELSEVANLTSLHANKITACAASIHDDVLVTASSDTTVKMWTKFCTDERSAKVLDGLDAPIINMEIKGNFIFAGTKNGSIRIWTLVGYKVAKVLSNDSYESISTITFKYFAGPECLEKYGTEVYALIGIFDNYGSCVVKKPFERREYFSLEGHGHPVVSCALTKNADRLLSSSLDNSVCLWKTCVGNDVSLADSSSRHKRKVTHVDFATSAPLALSADDAGTIIIWKCENEELEFVYSWTIPNSTIKSASFYTSDGQQLLIGSVTKHGMCEISIYTNHSTQNDPSCWKFRKTCWEKLNSEITFVLHSTSSNRIFVFDTENIVTGFDRKLSKLDNKRSLMEDWVMNAVFDPYDDDKILVTYATGSIKTYCWTQRRWEISVQYKEGEDINLSKVFEDEQLHSPTVLTTTKLVESESSGECQQFMILIGDSIGYLTIKRGTGLASTFETKKIHDAAIVNLVPIKNLLFSSSKDNSVKVWDLRSLKQVGIFRSDVAITSLACTNWNSAHDCKGDTPLSTVLLMLGTMTGHVQILKWTYRLSE